MNQPLQIDQLKLKVNILYFLVCLLLLFQLGQFIGLGFLLPNGHQESLKQSVLSDIKNDVPDIVANQVGQQIQELVWDKIKLEDKIQSASKMVSEPMVLKVGESIVRKKEFDRRFKEYQARPEAVGLTRSDQKKRFLEQLHKHYAILEDSRSSGLEERTDFREKLEDFQFKVFLTELLRQQVKPIGLPDIKGYYEEHRSLFEIDEVHSFDVLEGSKPSTLQEINNVNKFEKSSLVRKSFSNQSESKIPVQFLKALRSTSKGNLTAVLPFEGRYFLLKKTADSTRVYSPLKNVAPFIQSTLTFQRIRTLLSKLSNPLKFEFDVTLNSKGVYLIKNELVTQRYLALARSVLPKDFFLKAEENQDELRDLAMEFDLLFRKYKASPLQYSDSLHRKIEHKSEAFREQLVVELKRKELLIQAQVGEKELKSYYEVHKDKFVKSVGRWVSHIFITERSKALKVLNLALDDPRGFAQLAEEHSEHSATKSHGGDMRYLNNSEVTKQMHAVAETLKEGEVHPELISGKNGNGFHILRYVKTVPGKISSFEEVEDRLRELLLKDQQNRLIVNFIERVMTKYPAKVDNTILAQL